MCTSENAYFCQPICFRRQPVEFFFSKKICQMKAGQNKKKKYDKTNTSIVQVCVHHQVETQLRKAAKSDTKF